MADRDFGIEVCIDQYGREYEQYTIWGNEMKPTAVSFFCGAGGMDLGFIQAGFEIKAAWDWDSNAIKSYVENIGDHANVMDIKEMDYSDIPPVDVWLFGFPCQDLSVAGKQKGLVEGERSSMFFHVMRLLEETRDLEPDYLPKIIMAENVKGLKPYLTILEEEYAKQGYKMQFQIFNSKYWGVPQNRERYFVVGIREDLPQTFQFSEEQKGFVPKLKTVLEPVVDEKYYVANERAKTIIDQAIENAKKKTEETQEPKISPLGHIESYGENGFIHDTDGIVGALKATCYKSPKMIVHEPQIIKLGDLDVNWNNERMKRVFSAEGVSPTVTTDTEGWTQIKVLDEEAYIVRRLTPREYMRLQGFPEDYKIVVSNTQAYKQMGNAVSVPVAKGTALKIKEYLEGLS